MSSKYCFKQYLLIIILSTTILYTIVSLISEQNEISSNSKTFSLRSVEKIYAANSTLKNSREISTNQKIVIVTWTKRWGLPYPLDGLDSCADKNIADKCLMTRDRKFMNRSSAVIFHVRDIDYMDMPMTKPAYSKFVFFSHESPEMTFIPLNGLPLGYFDWTMSYRLDSHIYCPYGYIEPTKNPVDNAWKRYVKNKTKLIAWFVSNCQTDSKRELFVYELQKYLQVDVYGQCGRLECPKSKHADCNEFLKKTYKFYLSLENAACKDYVTEKFFYRLYEYVVPIVLRRSDYSRIAPNNSFIALDDFASPQHLAKFLLDLDKNNEKYLQYFEWRRGHDVVTDTMTRFCYCDLCENLVQEKHAKLSRTKKTLNFFNVHDWWYVNGRCDHKYAYNLLRRNST